jgi:dihydropteroate synthase
MIINGKKLDLNEPNVMSIVNLTPDSFYIDKKLLTPKSLLKKIENEIELGCFIFDLGAESSKPGTNSISVDEEIKRLLPSLKLIRNTFPEIFISIDTYRSETALAASEFGADLINDISSGILDKKMISTVAQLKLPYIAMHMKGNPKTMQSKANYKNCVSEVFHFFEEKLKACKIAGIKEIIIDPGFGFAKHINHNYQLLNELEKFKKLKVPILVGLSRKSMIQSVLNCDAKNALNGTTALNTIALLKGASILRVHDVKETMEVVKLFNALKKLN